MQYLSGSYLGEYAAPPPKKNKKTAHLNHSGTVIIGMICGLI